ncbi:MAG: FecR domain-containing protein, partial [Saprospiraceae bacterium]
MNIETILSKVVTNEASETEMNQLNRWSESSIENLEIYNEYKSLWKAAAGYEPLGFIPETSKAYESHLNLLKKTRSLKKESNRFATVFNLRTFSRIAAVLTIGIAAMIGFNKLNTHSITADDSMQFVSLQDGSSVWLEAGSTISYNSSFNKSARNVKLDGKAFFNVARNEQKVFNIESADLNISVLGTSFTIDHNTVNVQQGKVSVSAGENKVLLIKNQGVTLIGKKLEKKDVTNSAFWRNPNLSFDNAPLAQVVADINLYYNSKINIANKIHDTDCPFTSGG